MLMVILPTRALARGSVGTPKTYGGIQQYVSRATPATRTGQCSTIHRGAAQYSTTQPAHYLTTQSMTMTHHAVQCYRVRYNAVESSAVHCGLTSRERNLPREPHGSAVQHKAVLRSTQQGAQPCSAVHRSTKQYIVVHSSTQQYCAAHSRVHSSAVQCSAVECGAVQCSTEQ